MAARPIETGLRNLVLGRLMSTPQITRGPSANLAFSSRLMAEFHRRQSKNPSFSLRAFARQLDVDASELSKLLRSQRVAGTRLVSRLGKRLGWSDAEIDTVRSYQSRVAPTAGETLREPGFSVAKQLDEELFAALSSWHYFAILSLLKDGRLPPSRRLDREAARPRPRRGRHRA